MLSFFTLFAILFTLGSSSPLVDQLNAVNGTYNIQAVLIAGSNEFYNYRHQADICHAYHVLRNHGVPAENIIVFMYDDIANNRENPFPGKIYNIPNGPDVYEGVAKDYTGKDVNVANFLGALKGDKELAAKGKKVLTTGPNDHVFIYFSDHGGAGILGMPSEYLSSQDLNDALVYMNKNQLYGKLTFYVEACEAGSIFDKILADNLNIFVTTASNPEESSYGVYCDVEGPLSGTCLGDEYSVAWLQDSDKQDLKTETLEQQFKNVVKNTPSSHPQEYGQKSLSSLDVGEFQGESASTNNIANEPVPASGQVNSRDIPLHSLRSKIISSNDASQVAIHKKQLSKVIAARKYLKKSLSKVIQSLCSAGFCPNVDRVYNTRKPLVDHKTYDKVVKQFHSSCLNIGVNSDVLKYMYTFVNLVEENKFNESTLKIFLQTLEKSCKKHFANNQFQAIV
ncbi:legumain-like [Panonychus citri]|uniref:legumain-like n=1 Tax=Panonychus citri TaxID=50023 RepID=UPI00230807A8|nr:legumain-like [Panonychus citri]